MIKASVPDFGLTIRLLNTDNSDYKKLDVSGGTVRMRNLLKTLVANGYGKFGHIMGDGPYLPEDVFIILTHNKIRYIFENSSEEVENFDVPEGAIS